MVATTFARSQSRGGTTVEEVRTPRFLLSGPLRLDCVEERLWRDGKLTPLGGKPLALLRAFMESPQMLLTKEDLVERVWSGLAVSDTLLTTTIKDLRKVLGDDARSATFIGTVHGRGYRYLLPVEASDDVAPARKTIPRRWLLIGGGAAAAAAALVGGVALYRRAPERIPDSKSVAVLPFTDLSEGRDQGWFADGLTEEVLNTLNRAPDLRVTSQQALAQFTQGGRDPRAVARQLGVSNLLEGSVRRSGARLRVTVKLVHVSDGAHVWSQTYDREGADLMRVQEDIAFDIARALKTVTDPAQLRAMVEVGTRSVDAYDAYVRGLGLERRESLVGDGRFLRAAGEAYETARRLDPAFANAHWQAAQVWFGNSTSINPTGYPELPADRRLSEALSRVDQAVAASPNDVDRLKYQSGAAWMRLRLRPAQRLMAQYLAARPNDVDAWTVMTDLSVFAGEQADFEQASERVHALSLLDGAPRSRALAAPFQQEDYALAYQRARQQLAVQPGDITTVYQAHRAYLGADRLDDARALLRRISASDIPASTRLLAEQRQACADGRFADAAALGPKIEAAGELGARWVAAQQMGDEARSRALLRPLDTPAGLPTLIQFMIYPSFDPADFPELSRVLRDQGIRPRRTVPIRNACPAGGRS